MDIQGILGIDSDVRNGYDDIKVTFHIDADASQEGDRGDRGAVAEAFGGVRHHHQPDQRDRRSRLTSAPSQRAAARRPSTRHRTRHDGRHRRRACGTGDEPLPHRALDRSRRARTRRGRQLLAPRTLGLAAAADAELAEPAARLSLRRRRPRRLHDDGRGRRRSSPDSRRSSAAPVRTHTTVTSVSADRRRLPRRHRPRASSTAAAVVLASGACNLASVPTLRAGGADVDRSRSLPLDYRNPQQLPEGGVLVVGASATGVQLADEIHRSGRRVTLSVGEHVRLPRMYRGRDVLWWMEASGVWNQRYDEIDDLTRARGLPSPQLVGTPERTTLDLNALGAAGVEIVGRLAAMRDGRALFSGGLRNQFALADLKMERLLDTFDEWARQRERRSRAPVLRNASSRRACPASSRLALDLRPRRDPLHRVGHGLSPRLQLARRAGGRPQGPPAARRRRRRCARLVRAGASGAAATQVDLHSRRRRRRARHRRSSRRVSRQPPRLTRRDVGRARTRTATWPAAASGRSRSSRGSARRRHPSSARTSSAPIRASPRPSA